MGENRMKEGYLRISITNRCNFNCFYCSPEISPGETDCIRTETFRKILTAASRTGIEKIRITGGEALLHPDIEGILNTIGEFQDISFGITTNGSLLGEYISELWTAGVRKVNISLDTLDGEKFKNFTGSGDFGDVFKSTVDLAYDPFFEIKLNNVVVRGKNLDEIKDFAALTKDKDIEVRFIEYMPIGERDADYEDKFVSEKRIRERIDDELKSCDHKPGSSARIYRLPGSTGRIGFISPVTRPFCKNCNRLRISSRLKIRGCLKDTDGTDLEQYINGSGKKLTEKLEEIFKQKNRSVKPFGREFQPRTMKDIGG